ncbi:MAG: Rpp14/Pop5 family protein [Candidatus Woesearchaeota archaeon]
MTPKGQKQGLKPLRPSMKEKKRYIVVRIASEKSIDPDDFVHVVDEACKKFLGILYYGKAGILVLKNQTTSIYSIIRVNHLYVPHVTVALQLIKEIKGIPVSCDVIGVSGILKKAREKFIPKK